MAVFMNLEEIAIRINRDVALVEHFVSSEWLKPARSEGPAFDEEDLARTYLILDLRESMGVNDEGIPIILDLLDQVHRLKREMAAFSRSNEPKMTANHR